MRFVFAEENNRIELGDDLVRYESTERFLENVLVMVFIKITE